MMGSSPVRHDDLFTPVCITLLTATLLRQSRHYVINKPVLLENGSVYGFKLPDGVAPPTVLNLKLSHCAALWVSMITIYHLLNCFIVSFVTTVLSQLHDSYDNKNAQTMNNYEFYHEHNLIEI